MNKIIKSRWVLFVVWIVMAVILKMLLPDLGQLALEKGQAGIPSGYSSQVAKQMVKEMNNKDEDSAESTIMIVFTSKKPLTNVQMKNIKAGVNKLEDHEDKLKITNLTTHFDNEDLEDQLVSKDKTTVLAAVTVDKSDESINDIRDGLKEELSSVSVEHYLTGSDLINSDYSKTMQDGTKKTEVFTYVTILIILLLVFRSPVTPVISLLTIGITFICSLGVVAQLVDKFNFPYSNMTQTFLILVLFGIGTDYNILLLMRFREELKHNSINNAIITTYKTAGKTLLFSSLTVLIGFIALAFAKFSIYRSASAVAIAVCMLLLELTTFLPFFMKVLGHKLFWPSNVKKGHGRNGIWEKITSFSVKHSAISLVVILAIMVPLMLLCRSNLSYNTMEEVNPSFESIKGFNISADKFGKGKTFPVNVVIKNDKAMDNNTSLSDIDEIANSLKKVSGVKSVYSATRPKGEIIDDLYIDDQTKKVSDGIDSADDGVVKIKDGLDGAKNKLPNDIDTSGIDKLISGTDSINENLLKVDEAMKMVDDGIKSGAKGASDLSDSLEQLKSSTDKLNSSTKKLLGSYDTLKNSFAALGDKYNTVNTQIGLIKESLVNINNYAAALAKTHPEVKNDQYYIALTKTAAALSDQVEKLNEGMDEINKNYAKALDAFGKANGGLGQISDGQVKIASGIDKLQSGSDKLSEGLSRGSDGQAQIISNMPKISDGLSQINDGQSQVKSGMENVGGSLDDLKQGLSNSTDGLDQVSDGLKDANDYLDKLSSDKSSKEFYIPKDKLEGDDFQKSLDTYMSDSRKITKLTVYLDTDPYSENAIQVVNDIESTTKAKIKGTSLEKAEIGLEGASSQNRDLSLVSSSDLSRSKIIMLIGIGIVLILVTRSLLIPLYVIASLMISYYSSMALTQFIFKDILGRGDLSWSVPFFIFIMLIALGVDYSIFLISRFNEYKDMDPKKAIVEASANIGGVITTAAIILSATFAAMYPSNIPTLIELGTSVIIGLFMLAFIFMPIFIPAMISLSEKFRRKQSKDNIESFDEKELKTVN